MVVQEKHPTSMVVWDVPSPFLVAEKSKVKIGLRCHECCNLGGERVEVMDANGAKVGEGKLSSSPWERTDALYWTEVKLSAPNEAGYYEWTARFLDGKSQPTHVEAMERFGAMVEPRPQHFLKVSVTDAVTRAPLDNAYVRVGSSTIFSNETGTAGVSVANSTYELVVWKRNHRMFKTNVDVTNDVDLKVELLPHICKYCPDRT